MIKKLKSFIMIFCMVILAIGCGNKNIENEEVVQETQEEDTIKIMESRYMEYIYDIYLDSGLYLGKILEVEGMFQSTYNEEEKNEEYYVYRLTEEYHDHGDSSHVEEQMSGFRFESENIKFNNGDWIKVRGVLKEDKNGDIYIEAESVEVQNERGAEKVYRKID